MLCALSAVKIDCVASESPLEFPVALQALLPAPLLAQSTVRVSGNAWQCRVSWLARPLRPLGRRFMAQLPQQPLFASAPPPCRRLTRGRAARQLFRALGVPLCRRNRRRVCTAASEAAAATSGAVQAHRLATPSLAHGFGGAVVAQLCTAPVVEHAPGWLSVALVEHESVPFTLTAHLCKRHAASAGASPRGARGGLRLVYMMHGGACASLPAEVDSFSGSPACSLRAMSLSAGDSALLDGDAVLTRASGEDDGGCEFVFAALDIHVPEPSTRRAAPAGGKAHPALGSDAVQRLLCHRTPGSSKAMDVGSGSRPRVRGLLEADTYRLPGQSNRVALVFDPKRDGSLAINFTMAIEAFPPGHVTPRHTHTVGYELFVILSGTGTAQCEAESWPVGPGSVVVFPPTLAHGIDVDAGGRMYCLQMMLPDDSFADFVRSGSRDEEVGGAALREEDLCALVGCDLELSVPDADSRGRSAR